LRVATSHTRISGLPPAVARRHPSGENAVVRTNPPPLSSVVTTRWVMRSQMMVLPLLGIFGSMSAPHAASRFPSGENATPDKRAVAPLSFACSSPVEASQSWTDLAAVTVARVFPSGDTVTAFTGRATLRESRSFFVSTSRTWMNPVGGLVVPPAVAAHLPSAVMATASTSGLVPEITAEVGANRIVGTGGLAEPSVFGRSA
jgi:hypothetical protein